MSVETHTGISFINRPGGGRIRVSQIAIEHEQLGMTPEEIQEAHPHLTTEMIKRLSGTAHSGFDRPQGMVPGQLCEEQRDELAPRPQFSDAIVSLMGIYGFLKFKSRNPLKKM